MVPAGGVGGAPSQVQPFPFFRSKRQLFFLLGSDESGCVFSWSLLKGTDATGEACRAASTQLANTSWHIISGRNVTVALSEAEDSSVPMCFVARATDPAGNTATKFDAFASFQWTPDFVPPTTAVVLPVPEALEGKNLQQQPPPRAHLTNLVRGSVAVRCYSGATNVSEACRYAYRLLPPSGFAAGGVNGNSYSCSRVDKQPADGSWSTTNGSFTAEGSIIPLEAAAADNNINNNNNKIDDAPVINGVYTLLVCATDAAGNVESSPTQYLWEVDTETPRVSVTSTSGEIRSVGDFR